MSIESPKRRFTGIFIPVEILEIEELTYFEMLLLAQIDALYCPDHGGCYSTNEALGQVLKVQENTIAKGIVRLRRLELIEDISFNGRKRVIRALIGRTVDRIQSQKASQSKSALESNPGLDNRPSRVGQPSNSECDDCPMPIYKDESKYEKVSKGNSPGPVKAVNPERTKTPSSTLPHLSTKKEFKPGVWFTQSEYQILKGMHDATKLDGMLNLIASRIARNPDLKYSLKSFEPGGWVQKAYLEANPAPSKAIGPDAPVDEAFEASHNRMILREMMKRWKPSVNGEAYIDTFHYVQLRNYNTQVFSEMIYFKDTKFFELLKAEMKKRNYVKNDCYSGG